VESQAFQTSLTLALDAPGRQLVALVGAGGKTTALQRLCAESSSTGGILATTTTAMFARQLSCLGPLLVQEEDETPLAARVVEALRAARVVTLARSRGPDKKVKGLAPAAVDSLWRDGVAGSIFVEADGSRGLSLKTFGEAEPQLPSATTTVVVVAGLDVLGRPLDEDHVHRAGLLLPLVDAEEGDPVTPQILAAALALQIARLRALTPDARVVVLLNKAESDDRREQAAETADRLLASAPGRRGTGAPAPPDRIVTASLQDGVYRVEPGGRHAWGDEDMESRAGAGGSRVLGVVLAAGMGTRMGGTKVVRPVAGKPMVERVVDAALGSRLAATAVVVGHEAEGVRAILEGRPVHILDNPSFADGLSTSVRAALLSFGPDYDAALFLLADQPFVTAGLIDRLLEAYAASGRPIVRPEVDGRPGNPVLFSSRLFPELLRETGDRGGREVVQQHAGEVCLVAVDDPSACLDVDSLEEYERVRKG
jgi:molybdenum cofactor cytidylyltransferase